MMFSYPKAAKAPLSKRSPSRSKLSVQKAAKPPFKCEVVAVRGSERSIEAVLKRKYQVPQSQTLGLPEGEVIFVKGAVKGKGRKADVLKRRL